MRLALFLALLLVGAATRAATLTVTSAADTAGSLCGAVCTLRQAITVANVTAAADTINFAITVPIRGEILIQPASPLPTINQPLTINGYSQSGTRVNDSPDFSNAILRIRIDGLLAGSGSDGLNLCAPNSQIRGLAITRFLDHGIRINSGCSATGSSIAGVFIGLASSGVAAFGNTNALLLGAGPVTLGGTALADRNVVAGNFNGISIASSATVTIANNLIGTDKTGSVDFGQSFGITNFENTTGNAVIGLPGAPNRIRFNTTGIQHRAAASVLMLYENHIDSNGVGIDLGNPGVTPNDADDADSGPNGLQNFPVIAAAERVAGGLSLSGTLDVGPSQGGIYRIALYASANCDPSGFGEGERFLGSFSRSINNAAQSFQTNPFVTGDPLPPGTFITATATSPGLATSEFSQCFSLDPVPWVVNSANDVADGLCNATHCSLRDALIAANSASDPRPQSIHFNIATPAAGEIMIQPTTPLPTIARTLAIDGYTQPGTAVNSDPQVSNALLRIRVHGPSIVFSICADDVTLRGLAITGATQLGIVVGANAAGGLCTGVRDATIAGNFIGVAANGVTAAANATGIRVLGARVRIGGEAPADRNVISSNDDGVTLINSGIDGSVIAGNLIGTDKSGLLNRGNNLGLRLENAVGANEIRIGTEAAPNRLAFNTVGIRSAANTNPLIAVLAPNLIRDSAGLGIDLGALGVTANDVNDVDSGPNGLQNFPVLTRAIRTANGLGISGILDVKVGTSNAPYRIDIYASDSCAASGHGEGAVHIGSASVNLTQTSGEFFDFELTTDANLVATDRITATATSGEGTSEFSTCLTASDLPPGIVVNTDADPLTPTTVGCDLTECTLREAITLANLQQGADLIRFAIPENLAPFDILLDTPLPVILDGLTIDGYTQPGAFPNASASAFDAVIKVNLRAFNALQNLLRVCAGDPVTIRGLAFTGAEGPALVSGTNDSGNCNIAGILRVQGNQFGIAPSGARFSNGGGILADKTFASIGGANPADRNLISNSTTFGVRIASSSSNGSNVRGNVFGRDLNDSFDDPNARDIEVSGASDVLIGAAGSPEVANRFYGSAQAIVVLGTVSRRVIALGNAHIRHTGATAIDLAAGSAADGITANDANDADTGPNELQNTVVLLGGSVGVGTITINGTLDVPTGVAAPVDYRLAFYESTTCSDQPGIGNGREGEVFLGSVLRPFSSSAESFSVELPVAPPLEATFITAVVLAPDANMSEFSNCLPTPRPDPVFANGFE